MGRWLLGWVLVAVAACVAGSLWLFPDGSTNLDEVAYRAQAEAFEAGHLTLDAAETLPWFRPYLSGVEDDDVVFKYQPVWPATLAASSLLTGSTLPARILVAAGAVLAVHWLAREAGSSPRGAVIAAAVTALSPIVWIQSATVLGYLPSFTLVTASAAALLALRRRPTWSSAVTAGLVASVAAAHRPFDALLALTPFALYALWPRAHRRRVVAGLVVGAAPAVAAVAAYNAAVTGAPWRLPFDTSGGLDRFGFGVRASFLLADAPQPAEFTLGSGLSATATSLGWLTLFVAGGPLLLVPAVAAVRGRARGPVGLLVLAAALTASGYVFWWGTANYVSFTLHRSLGPAYHLVLLAPLAVLGARGVERWWPHRHRAGPWRVIAAGAGATLAVAAITLPEAAHEGNLRSAEVALLDGDRRRLVVDSDPVGGLPYIRYVNEAELGGTVLVAVHDGEGRLLDLLDEHPDRLAYEIRHTRSFDGLFGSSDATRVPLDRRSADAVELTAAARPGAGGRFTVPYLRIGDSVQAGGDGRWRLDASMLPARATVVEVGLVAVAPGTEQATGGITTVEELDRHETVSCRIEARASGDRVETLLPCAGSHHYVFGPDRQTDAVEDLTAVLDTSVSPAAPR